MTAVSSVNLAIKHCCYVLTNSEHRRPFHTFRPILNLGHGNVLNYDTEAQDMVLLVPDRGHLEKTRLLKLELTMSGKFTLRLAPRFPRNRGRRHGTNAAT